MKKTNETLKSIKERRSIRKYADKAIDKNILKEIVDAARLAPSGMNVQPWEFVVVTEKEILKKLAEAKSYGYFIQDSAACIVVFCKDTKYFLEDGCNASMSILLAAKSFGIGSCWVAGHGKDYEEDVKRLFGVPEDYHLISILPLGYPDEKPEPHDKRKLQDVMHWEKF
jgi:nitroreductase